MMALKQSGHLASDEPDHPHHYNGAFSTVYELIGTFADENQFDMAIYPASMPVIPEGRNLISKAMTDALQETLKTATARKGEERGECNRFRCANTNATYLHKDNGKYYCKRCALYINRENNGALFDLKG